MSTKYTLGENILLRILHQFILTALFAVFASQASAMFIQPDWFDPTQPGVGTNRYSYSFNDPINKMDPLGNESWDLTRSQEDSDRANAEAAQDALDRAERIRERGTFWDGLRDDLGLDDYWDGRADNHASRIGKSWGERALGDAVTGVEIGSLAAAGGAVVQGGKALARGIAARRALATLATERAALSSAANAAYKDTAQTVAGRALTKHPNVAGFRNGDELSKALRSPQATNEAAERAVSNILSGGTRTQRAHSRFGDIIEYTLPSGIGARFSASTNGFIGFLGRGI
ncbi:hypothetical protein [Tritonibacter sp. SIMBA_163]|uniref:hypothetical protein n=1 Tax=Tritonibacter sp. SIMBA_163 TaxID=3080868 RepID=UPI003981281D